jgi:hypothetical protein
MCEQSPSTIHTHLWLVVGRDVSTNTQSEGSGGYTVSCGYLVEEHRPNVTASTGPVMPCG